MSRWLIRIGIFFLVVGILLVSPLADLMPVDLAGPISRPAATSHFRVVPGDEHPVKAAVALVLVGAVLLCAGLFTRRRI